MNIIEKQPLYAAAIKAIRYEQLALDADGLPLNMLDALRPGFDLKDVVDALAVAATDAVLSVNGLSEQGESK